jgi:hypothetical protein
VLDRRAVLDAIGGFAGHGKRLLHVFRLPCRCDLRGRSAHDPDRVEAPSRVEG